MHEFTTEVDVEIIGTFNEKSASGRAKVKWRFEMEMRERGVKSFSVYAPDQTISFDVERYDEEKDEEYTETITLELKDIEVDSTFGHSSKDIRYMSLIPYRLEKYGSKYRLDF